jgi:hypothetical protein
MKDVDIQLHVDPPKAGSSGCKHAKPSATHGVDGGTLKVEHLRGGRGGLFYLRRICISSYRSNIAHNSSTMKALSLIIHLTMCLASEVAAVYLGIIPGKGRKD